MAAGQRHERLVKSCLVRAGDRGLTACAREASEAKYDRCVVTPAYLVPKCKVCFGSLAANEQPDDAEMAG